MNEIINDKKSIFLSKIWILQTYNFSILSFTAILSYHCGNKLNYISKYIYILSIVCNVL